MADLELCAMNFAQLRDQLLAADPLDAHWVARVNRAEVQPLCRRARCEGWGCRPSFGKAAQAAA